MLADCHSILGLISSPTLSERRARALREKTGRFTGWSMMPAIAAKGQVGPLLYWHLKEYGIEYPRETRRTLAAMHARQKTIGHAQAETLADICRAFAAAGIDAVVIKGGALAHIIYAELGLRPMEDLDILVARRQAGAAHALLLEMGFHAPLPASRFDRLQHHYPPAQRTLDEITVSVELHTAAFNLLMRDDLSMDNVMQPLRAYTVAGQPAWTLNPLQMLWMQYLGLRKLAEPLRHIHLADLVGMAEVLVGEIDWARLRQAYPSLWNAYEAVHAFSALDDAVCRLLGLAPDRAPAMQAVGQDFPGWPRRGFSQLESGRERRRLIVQTLVPPEWWARLVYGVRTTSSMTGILFCHHPYAFLQQGLRRLYLGPASASGFFKAPG
jgi:hypothetical protein